MKTQVELEALQEQLRVRKEKQYQLLEKLQKEGYEVIFALDQIDEIALQGIGKFEEYDVIDASKENIDMGEKSEDEKAAEEDRKSVV